MFRVVPCSSSGGQIVLLQRLVLSLSVNSCLQRVTVPDAVIIQFLPPEDEHGTARNMSRIIM